MAAKADLVPPAAAPQVATMPAGGASPLARTPILLIAGLFAFLLLPRVHSHTTMFWSFAGAGSALLVWLLALWALARARGKPLRAEGAAPVKQHYVQACVQACLYGYWGWYWRPIYDQLPLIVAQLLFVFSFDALFSWSRGRVWRFASGPAPIVLSTNLFIWFRDDWFYLQWGMIVAGLLGKEFIKWQKEGRRTHVFNPSGFGLLVAAVALIASGATETLTQAKALATTIDIPPQIFVVLFCLGLVVQHFFAVTLMTFAAAVVMVLINLGYTWTTGVYLFASTNLPAAAFLGLHLLMTDPSTSPRTNLGRTLFGAGYGLGYVVAFQVLGKLGAPELFAKLFPVPILNTCVKALDHLARTGWTGRLNTRWETALRPGVMNHVHMALWSVVFFVMLGTGYVQHPHPGDSIPFWKEALAEGKPDAGRKLVMVAGSQAVAGESADALNELGVISIERKVAGDSESTAMKSAADWWAKAAARGSLEACANILMLDLFEGARASDEAPQMAYQRLTNEVRSHKGGMPAFLVGCAFEKGGDGRRAIQFYLMCGSEDLLAVKGITRIGLGGGAGLVDLSAGAGRLERAAEAGDGESCWYLTYMRARGAGVLQSDGKAAAMRARAEQLGFPPAVQAKGGPLPEYAPPGWRVRQRPAWATAFPLQNR